MAGFDRLKYLICTNQEISEEKCRNVSEYFEWIFRVRKIKEWITHCYWKLGYWKMHQTCLSVQWNWISCVKRILSGRLWFCRKVCER